jgi:hypothetical protein
LYAADLWLANRRPARNVAGSRERTKGRSRELGRNDMMVKTQGGCERLVVMQEMLYVLVLLGWEGRITGDEVEGRGGGGCGGQNRAETGFGRLQGGPITSTLGRISAYESNDDTKTMYL